MAFDFADYVFNETKYGPYFAVFLMFAGFVIVGSIE